MSKALTLDRTIYSNWSDDVMFYLNNIRKFEVLSPEEEVAVFEKIKYGTPEESEAARKKIWESNQRFVYSVAKQYAKGNEIMDLIEECNIGLNDAIDKFDTTKGMKFISYAVWYIRRAVVAHITNNGAIVRSANKQKLMGILPRIKEKFYQENHRDATPDEIIELLEKDFDVKIKESEDVFDMSVSSISDTMVGDNDSPSPSQIEYETSTASYNEYEDQIESESKEYLVERLLSVCTEKERGIMKMLYGIGYDRAFSPEDVAEVFGMTKTRILQIKKNLIKKMQKAALQMKTV
jgi:RNA polymerase primary sigma factor